MSVRCARTARVATLILYLGTAAASANLSVSIDQGTNFSLTLSPDGRYAALDLQGHLWILPAEGGKARAITDGRGDDRLPRWSPDGQRICFQSFRGGSWDIWTVSPDGSDPVALTQGPHDDREPVWTPDSQRVVFTSDRAGNYDLWSIDRTTGQLEQLTRDPADDYAPALSADGETMAFVSTRGRRPSLYLRRAAGIEKLADLTASKLFAPAFSPDGTTIAAVVPQQQIGFPYIADNRLVLFDLNDGTQTELSATTEDVFGFAPAWLDQDTLLYTADGRIRQRKLNTASVIDVPFTATIKTQRQKYRRANPVEPARDARPVKGIVYPTTNPRTDDVAFVALGDLWLRSAAGEVRRLTRDAFVERDPKFSPDGRLLAFVSDRGGPMQVWALDLQSGEATVVSNNRRGARNPSFSPDGQQLAYQQVGPRGTQDFTLHVLDFASGDTRRLRSAPALWPETMSWSGDGQHLLVAALMPENERFRDGANQLVRINVAADEMQVLDIAQAYPIDFGPSVSPDGAYLALVMDGGLWTAPVAPDGRLTGPPEQRTAALAEYPSWTADSTAITFLGNTGLSRVGVDSGRIVPLGTNLEWQAPKTNSLLIHAGRLFDGLSPKYREDVDIIITNDRISRVRRHRRHSPDTEVIDASNRTVLPGLIDHHVHFQAHDGEWVGRAWLAFGVTSIVEPGGLPYESKEHQEAWASGARTGPRLFFAGPQLDGARRYFPFAVHINNAARLDREFARAERLGYALMKTYTRLPVELQRQTVAAAHDLGLPVTSHGVYPALAFGGDRVEHLRGTSRHGFSPKQSDRLRTYDDIVGLVGATRAAITPTIAVSGGFFAYLLDDPDIANNAQYANFFDPGYRRGLAGFARILDKRRSLLDEGVRNARDSLLNLHLNGALIVAGTDAPIFPYGLSLIIELANYVDAGLTPAEALRTATSNAARALGAGAEIGRIKAGMLADLIIVDGDPLSDVSELLNVETVISNGRPFSLEQLMMPTAR